VDVDADGMTSRWDLADAIRDRYRLRSSVVDIVDELHEGTVQCTKFDPMVGAALRIAGEAGWVPVIVSNGETRQQEAKIRHTGLDRFVADWVISQEVDVRKPNPRIFEIAAERGAHAPARRVDDRRPAGGRHRRRDDRGDPERVDPPRSALGPSSGSRRPASPTA
jgi:putative hydrolase of the HAD superfamily